MTPVSLPEDWQDLVTGYVLGDLTPDEATLVEQWCQDYPEVAAELVALKDTWHTLPLSLPQQVPPPDLKARILDAAQGRPHALAKLPAPRWPAYGLGLGWAMTAIALGVMVMENQTLRQRTATLETILVQFQNLQNPVYTLAGTPTHPEAAGRLVIDTQRQHALILTEDLPPLPSGEVYRLWALVEDGEPVFCGQFNPGGEVTADFSQSRTPQPQQWNLLSEDCETAQAQMLITHEIAAAPPVPQGPLVLVSGGR